MKKWKTIYNSKLNPALAGQKFKVEEIIKILLRNRDIKTEKEIKEFLNPQLENVTVERVGINKKQLQKAVDRINEAIKNNETIVIYGDYDVDGICGTAILWETLYGNYKNVFPYIPHRVDEGYGLSIKGIENLLAKKVGPLSRSDLNTTKLIITVDNGIVANTAVDFANKNGIDVIITDHHVPGKKLPSASAIVHTTKLCGAGVAYVLSQKIGDQPFGFAQGKRSNLKNEEDDHLELVALATVADLVPLIGPNRTLLTYGIERLRHTKRQGLLALFTEAGIDRGAIRVYEIGHIIAPRLNATGRLEYAMDSLRLLCTKDNNRATLLAQQLGRINRERQQLTEETVIHAKEKVKSQSRLGGTKVKSLLFLSNESYQQGVIGLVAGKLVEEFYRPAIVVSKGKVHSKASARSVSGFNIIEFIRSASDLLVDAGGHPMAAGFTVETAKLSILQKTFEDMAQNLLDEHTLTRTLRIDCEVPLTFVSAELYGEIQKLAPFGMGNPEPTFVSLGVVVKDMRVVGNGGKHLKLRLAQKSEMFDAIAFGMGERASEFHTGDVVDIVYVIDENRWNGNIKLQLKIRDFRKSD